MNSSNISKRVPAALWGRLGILAAGVLVLPLLISFAVGGGELSESLAIRMAFATVAGQAVAVSAATYVVVRSVQVKESPWRILVFGVVLVFVVCGAIVQVQGAEDLLETRLAILS